MIGRSEGGVRAERLGLTEDVGERDVRERRHRPLDQLHGRGRRAVGDRLEGAEVGAREVGMVEDALQHGRHEEDRRDSVPRDQAQPLARVEAGLDHRRASGLECAQQTE